MHYIRFLRTPQCDVSKKHLNVSAVIAVQTDLGDALLKEDVLLLVNILDAKSESSVLQSQPLQWQATSRVLKFTLACPSRYLSRLVRVHVTTENTASAIELFTIPKILDVWSCEFLLSDKQRSEPLVERQLLLPNKTSLRMWEETGESIARHIWDASVGFLVYFSRLFSKSPTHEATALTALVKSSKVRRLKVLELGAGCGVVGIAFAQLVKCDMHVTDLEDAQEILTRNTRYATPMAGSKIQADVLDWASSPEDSSNTNFDLILVSDCIYNPDSSLHLVEILGKLVARAPDTLILVGFKRRHEADTVFFEHMGKTSFEHIESINIPLPHTLSDYDADTPTIEFFTYRHRPIA